MDLSPSHQNRGKNPGIHSYIERKFIKILLLLYPKWIYDQNIEDLCIIVSCYFTLIFMPILFLRSICQISKFTRQSTHFFFRILHFTPRVTACHHFPRMVQFSVEIPASLSCGQSCIVGCFVCTPNFEFLCSLATASIQKYV